jgi:integrase
VASTKDRREYGSGSVYQRKDGKWIGAAQAGFTASGGRRRVTVVGRTEAEAKRRLRDKIADVKAGEVVMSPTTTVKAWSDTWLKLKQRELSPKGYSALAGPIRKWVVPTIGQKRLTALSPADVRAVESAQRDAGRKGTTCAATQRALFNMLRAAIAEGHAVPTRVLMAKTPKTSPSDRQPLSIPEALAVLAVASELPHGTRWAVALLTGMRQGECLGLTWDAVDFDTNTITVEWQLQRLPYLDKHDRSKGFRIPDEYEHQQVHKAWHLVRPKSKAGFREYPLLGPIADALRKWKEVCPPSPTGLVWPNLLGRAADHSDDLEEWHALQGTAGVGHPAGRYYHVHECRNVTATELRKAGADGLTITSLLGHTSLSTSEGYMKVDVASKRAALEKVAAMLELT